MTFSIPVISKVLKNQVSGMKRSFFSLKETCHTMGHNKDLLLIDIKGPGVISCMINDVNLTNFCLKKMGTKGNVLRGRIDKIEKQVVCEMGDAVNITYRCQTKSQKICSSSSKKICQSFNKAFAYQLELSHHSKLKKGAFESVNCYYLKKANGTNSIFHDKLL